MTEQQDLKEKSWEVENGVFCGLILCDNKADIDLKELGVKTEVEEHWLPCCIDLREIAVLRVRGYDEDALLTVLEGKGSDPDMYTVNAPMEQVRPHYVATRA